MWVKTFEGEKHSALASCLNARAGSVESKLRNPTARSPKGYFPMVRILNDERWPGGGGGKVATVELEIVRCRIVVIINLEAQAELGDAGQVEEG